MESCVLVVDDERYYRKLLSKIITENLKLKVITASNGLEALEVYKENLPSIITMDIDMPEMDGIEATRLIRTVNSSVKILVISGSMDGAAIKRIFEFGAMDYIRKPFTEYEVLCKISEIINMTWKPKYYFRLISCLKRR